VAWTADPASAASAATVPPFATIRAPGELTLGDPTPIELQPIFAEKEAAAARQAGEGPAEPAERPTPAGAPA